MSVDFINVTVTSYCSGRQSAWYSRYEHWSSFTSEISIISSVHQCIGKAKTCILTV